MSSKKHEDNHGKSTDPKHKSEHTPPAKPTVEVFAPAVPEPIPETLGTTEIKDMGPSDENMPLKLLNRLLDVQTGILTIEQRCVVQLAACTDILRNIITGRAMDREKVAVISGQLAAVEAELSKLRA